MSVNEHEKMLGGLLYDASDPALLEARIAARRLLRQFNTLAPDDTEEPDLVLRRLLGEVGTGSLAHDVNRWWHKIRGNEDPYLKIGQVNDRTKSQKSEVRSQRSAIRSQ